MSSANVSSSGESASSMGGSHAQFRFNGKPASFPLWKLKIVAHLGAQKLYEVTEIPLAATDKEVRKLLSMRAGDSC